MADQLTRCLACDGRGYHRCACWPADCICGYGDEDCDECGGEGILDASYDDLDCDCSNYETDLLEGRARCHRCGRRWTFSASEIEHQAAYMADEVEADTINTGGATPMESDMGDQDIVERLRKVGHIDYGLMTAAADLIESLRSELARIAKEREGDRKRHFEQAANICDKQASYFRGLSKDPKCLTDIRWNSQDEARHTMQSYAERHETDAAAIRQMGEKP